MTEINELYSENKTEMYDLLLRQLLALTEGEKHIIPNLANAAALIYNALNDINWAGFYLMTDGYLLLGPFQGKTACVKIPVGRGVCGTAVSENQTQLISDVHQFKGHIPCDGASNSEIVIPIRVKDEIIGVLDIDSPLIGRFDEEDKKGLESLAKILESACEW
ncbi:MAG: GAF domain-containing protein [Oscillospiraceae bacterium]